MTKTFITKKKVIMIQELVGRRSADTSTVASANTGKSVGFITQNKSVMNFCWREYADNINAPRDILGIADIGPLDKKVAKEATFVSTCMCMKKDTRARKSKSREHYSRCTKKNMRIRLSLVNTVIALR